MKIFHYDLQRAYLGESMADESPLEPGVFLVPFGATNIEPPLCGEKEIPVFENGAWTVEIDRRGETWWNETGAAVVVLQIGDPADAGLSDTPPPPAPPAVPASISRRQCARQLLALEMISGAEAVAMAATATPPAAVMTLIGALPADDQIIAKIDFAAQSYERAHPLISAMMAAAEKTANEVDDFFRAAAFL